MQNQKMLVTIKPSELSNHLSQAEIESLRIIINKLLIAGEKLEIIYKPISPQ